LDKVRVKGKAQTVAIYTPIAPLQDASPETHDELKRWNAFVQAYRSQNWEQSDLQLRQIEEYLRSKTGQTEKKFLYQLYAARVASRRQLPYDPTWDGATSHQTK
jgi:adenylate cyclase